MGSLRTAILARIAFRSYSCAKLMKTSINFEPIPHPRRVEYQIILSAGI